MSIMPLNSAAELTPLEVEEDEEVIEVENILYQKGDSISKECRSALNRYLWKSPPTLPPPTRRRADQMTFLCIALLLKSPIPLIGFLKKSWHRKTCGRVSSASKGLV